MKEATVDVLIEAEARQWNHEMTDGNFAPQEAKLIKKIPLAQIGLEDTLFQPLTKDGSYTYKSGYRFLKETKLEPQEESKIQDKNQWKGIWSLHVPIRVRNFIWRACQNSLPIKMNLVCRTVIANLANERCCETSGLLIEEVQRYSNLFNQ